MAAALLAGVMAGAIAVRADAQRGLEIAQTMKARDRGFGNHTAELKMVLIGTAGKETLRRLRIGRSRPIPTSGCCCRAM